MGVEVAALGVPELLAAETATSIVAGTEIVSGAALTAQGASVAGLSALGAEGAATYTAMEGLAGAAAAGATGANILNTAKTVATIASPFASLAAAASGASAARRFGGITNQPAVTPAVTMPTFGNADTLNAMRANIQDQIIRRGRAATILTSPSGSGDKLGN